MNDDYKVSIQQHIERDTYGNIDIIYIYNGILHICYNCYITVNPITRRSWLTAGVLYVYDNNWEHTMTTDVIVTNNVIGSAAFIKIPSKYDLRSYIVNRITMPLI